MKNPDIVGVRFIEPVRGVGFSQGRFYINNFTYKTMDYPFISRDKPSCFFSASFYPK